MSFKDVFHHLSVLPKRVQRRQRWVSRVSASAPETGKKTREMNILRVESPEKTSLQDSGSI